MTNKINKFIEYCNIKHNNKYDYQKTNFTKMSERIEIICPEHGSFTQIASQHKIYGCKKCGDKVKNQNKKITIDVFTDICKKRYNNKYDYSLVEEIKNTRSKVDIICPSHGIFKQTIEQHMISKIGCKQCYNEIRGKSNILLNDKVIENLKYVHPYYDYSLVDYKNSAIKIEIICNKHGVFKSLYHNLLNGSCCPTCKESKGEKAIREFLDKNNIDYIKEYYVNDSIGRKNSNIFDFYLPEKNIFIEFQGEQHYKPIEFFGGLNSYEKQIYKDLDKHFIVNLQFGGDLIEVPFYYLDRIDEFLEYKICK